MAQLNILHFPDPRLRLKAKPIEKVTDEIRQLANDMLETMREFEEGCLSVPEAYETVIRADTIRVRALNLQGETFEMDADGILATCIQHEIDHLEGKLFVDYLSNLKRQRIKKRLEKHQKQKL